MPWHSGTCSEWMHSETRTWHDNNTIKKFSYAGIVLLKFGYGIQKALIVFPVNWNITAAGSITLCLINFALHELSWRKKNNSVSFPRILLSLIYCLLCWKRVVLVSGSDSEIMLVEIVSVYLILLEEIYVCLFGALALELWLWLGAIVLFFVDLTRTCSEGNAKRCNHIVL